MPTPKRRTPRHQVNRRQKALAIRALEKVVADPNSPTHAVATAARALLNDGPVVSATSSNLEEAESARKLKDFKRACARFSAVEWKRCAATFREPGSCGG